MRSWGTYCCEALTSYCILRIYSATQGCNVVLCCIIIKVKVEGSVMPLKGGGRGAYWRAYSRNLLYNVRSHAVE